MNYRFQKGITIIELLVAMAISGILLIILVNSYLNYTLTLRKESLETTIQNEVNVISQKISQDIEKAVGVEGTVTDKDGKTYTPSENQIVLKTPALNPNFQTRYDEGNILYFDYIVYTLDKDNKKLLENIIVSSQSSRKEEKDKVLSKNLDSTSFFSFLPQTQPFSWQNVNTIILNLTFSSLVKGEKLERRLNIQVKLRNK